MSKSTEELAKWGHAVSTLQRWGFRVSLVDEELWLPESSFVEVVGNIEAELAERVEAAIREAEKSQGNTSCPNCEQVIEYCDLCGSRLEPLNQPTKERE